MIINILNNYIYLFMKEILKINGLNEPPPAPEEDTISPNNTKGYNAKPFFKET